MTIRKMKIEIAAAVCALVFLGFVSFAHADDDHGCRGNCGGGGGDIDINTGGNTSSTEVVNSIGGNTSKAFSLSPASLGGVDISGCWGSTQVSVFVLWAQQKLVLDPLCVADRYDQAGKHVLAAELRCQVPEVARLNYAGTTCIEANEFHVEPPAAAMPPPEPAAMLAFDEHHDDDDLIHDTADQLAELKAGLERERQARQAYARQAQAQQTAEAEYAQTVLDKLKTIDNGPEGSQ